MARSIGWIKLVFTQVCYPHTPCRARSKSNNPNPQSAAAYANDLQATAHASGIRLLRDSPELSVLRLELDPYRIEWIVFNPEEKRLNSETGNPEPPIYMSPPLNESES